MATVDNDHLSLQTIYNVIIAAVTTMILVAVGVLILVCALCCARHKKPTNSNAWCSCCWCFRRRKNATTSKCIQFYVKDKPGCLAKAVRVFKVCKYKFNKTLFHNNIIYDVG
jgi:hypothetical protein